jgi:hypothetical protein
LAHEEANGYVLEVKRIGADLGDGRSRVIYASNDDPENTGSDLDYYRKKLQKLGVVVPESMFEAVEEDAAHSNRCAQHFGDGRIIEGIT